MEKREYTVYKYDELPADAQQKARERFREHNDLSYTWDDTKADALNIGLKLAGTNRGYMKGDFTESAAVCAANVIREHGVDTETYATAALFLLEHGALWTKYRAAEDKDESTRAAEDAKEDLEQEFLRSLCEDYRIMQERDEEYQNSDEAIIETVRANDYDFTEDGRID